MLYELSAALLQLTSLIKAPLLAIRPQDAKQASLEGESTSACVRSDEAGAHKQTLRLHNHKIIIFLKGVFLTGWQFYNTGIFNILNFARESITHFKTNVAQNVAQTFTFIMIWILLKQTLIFASQMDFIFTKFIYFCRYLFCVF